MCEMMLHTIGRTCHRSREFFALRKVIIAFITIINLLAIDRRPSYGP